MKEDKQIFPYDHTAAYEEENEIGSHLSSILDLAEHHGSPFLFVGAAKSDGETTEMIVLRNDRYGYMPDNIQLAERVLRLNPKNQPLLEAIIDIMMLAEMNAHDMAIDLANAIKREHIEEGSKIIGAENAN